MKIEVLKENLKRGLEVVEKVIGKNLSLPILDNVLITAEDTYLQLTSTDLETAVKLWILAKIVKKGKVSVPVKILSNFVSLLPNDKVSLEEKTQNIHIQGGTFNNKIQGFNTEDFPLIPEFKDVTYITVDSQKICQGINQIIDIIQPSQNRSEISGIYCVFSKNSIILVATDSFRLAEKKLFIDTVSENISFILPQKTAKELVSILSQKEGNINIYFQGNQVMFELPMKEINHPEIQVTSRLIEGEYPNYEEIIPKKFKTVITLKRDEFLNQIKAASLFSGKINEVKIKVNATEKKIEIYSRDADIGENYSSIDFKGEGDDLEISFNYKFLIDGLIQMKSSEVTFSLNAEDSPCVLKPVGDESYLYVVMPIKF